MRIKTFTFLVLSCLLGFQACKDANQCATKDAFIEHFETFTQEFEKKKGDLTEEKKETYEGRYRDIVNNCYKKHKAEMTLKERQVFWKSSLAFYVARYDGNFSGMLNEKMDDPFNQYLKQEMVGIVKESGMGFILSLQGIVKDELPKLMEVFSKELEKIGNELFGGILEQQNQD